MFILCAILAIVIFLVTGGIGFPISIVLLVAGALIGGGTEAEA